MTNSVLLQLIIVVLIQFAQAGDIATSEDVDDLREPKFKMYELYDLLQNELPLDYQCHSKDKLVRWAYFNVRGQIYHAYCKDGHHYLRGRFVTNLFPKEEKLINIPFKRKESGKEVNKKEYDLDQVKWISFRGEVKIEEGADTDIIPAIASIQIGSEFFRKLKLRLDMLAELFEEQCNVLVKSYIPPLRIIMKEFDVVVPYGFGCTKVTYIHNIHKNERPNKILTYEGTTSFILGYNWKLRSFVSKAVPSDPWKSVTYNDNWKFVGLLNEKSNPHNEKHIPDDDYHYNVGDFKQDISALQEDITNGLTHMTEVMRAEQPQISAGVYLGEKCLFNAPAPSTHKEVQINQVCNKIADADYAIYYAPFREFKAVVRSQLPFIREMIKGSQKQTVRVMFVYKNQHYLGLTFSRSGQNYAINPTKIVQKPKLMHLNTVERHNLDFGVYLGEDQVFLSDVGNLNDVLGIKFKNYNRLGTCNSEAFWFSTDYTDWKFSVGDSENPIKKQVENNLNPQNGAETKALATPCSSMPYDTNFQHDINDLLYDMNGGVSGMKITIPVDGPRISGGVFLGKNCISQATIPSFQDEIQNKWVCDNMADTDYAIYYMPFVEFTTIVDLKLQFIHDQIKDSAKGTVRVILEYKNRYFLGLTFKKSMKTFSTDLTKFLKMKNQKYFSIVQRHRLDFSISLQQNNYQVSTSGYTDVVGIKFETYERLPMQRNNNVRWFDTFDDWKLFIVEEGEKSIQTYDPSQVENNSRPKIRMDAVVEDMKALCSMSSAGQTQYGLYNYFGTINIVNCAENDPFFSAFITSSREPGRSPTKRRISKTSARGFEEREAIGIHKEDNQVSDIHNLRENVPSLTRLGGDDFFKPLEVQILKLASHVTDSCRRVPENKYHTFDIVISTAILSAVFECDDLMVTLSSGSRKSGEENLMFFNDGLPMHLRYDFRMRKYEADWALREYKKSWTALVGVSAYKKEIKGREPQDNPAILKKRFPDLSVYLTDLLHDVALLSTKIDCKERRLKEGSDNIKVVVRFDTSTLIKARYQCNADEIPVIVEIISPNLKEAEKEAAMDYLKGLTPVTKTLKNVLMPKEKQKACALPDYTRQYYDLQVILHFMTKYAPNIQKLVTQNKNPDGPVLVDFILKQKSQHFVFSTTFDPKEYVYGMNGLTILYKTLDDDGGVRAEKKVYKKLVTFLGEESAFTPDAGIFRNAVAVLLEPSENAEELEKKCPSIKIPGGDWTIVVMVSRNSNSRLHKVQSVIEGYLPRRRASTGNIRVDGLQNKGGTLRNILNPSKLKSARK